MTDRIIFETDRVRDFLLEELQVDVCDNQTGIGLERDGKLIAGVIYHRYDGRNIWTHIRGTPGQYWLTRDYLRMIFYFPFVDAGCTRIWGEAEYNNPAAINLQERLGFKRKAVLEGACWDGGDVYIYAIDKEDCRYV